MTTLLKTSALGEVGKEAVRTRLVIPAIASWQSGISPRIKREGLTALEVEEAAIRAAHTITVNFNELFLGESPPLKYAKTTLRSLVIPEIWKSLLKEGSGILCSYEEAHKSPYEGQYKPLDKRDVILKPTRYQIMHIIKRHCRFDLPDEVRNNSKNSRDLLIKPKEEEYITRNRNKVKWNKDMYDRTLRYCRDWVRGKNLDSDDYLAICQIIAGICFFTGRRPWSEIGCKSRILVGESQEGVPPEDDWADGWVTVTNLAKKSERQREEGLDKVTLPVCGITAIELVDACIDLHDRLIAYEWFDLENDEISRVVKAKLIASGQKLMLRYIRPIFKPAIDKSQRKYVKTGYRLFRQLYTDYMFSVREAAMKRYSMYEDDYGLSLMDSNIFGMIYLSHEDPTTTALYNFWLYRPDYVYK
jgi:hypothetical protein